MAKVRISWLFAAVLSVGLSFPVSAEEALVQLYLVRHTEVDYPPVDPDFMYLSEVGHARAALLVPTLEKVSISHLFASHTIRSRQTLEPLAKDRGLPIVQLPQPGSRWKGDVVTDQLSRREPIEPIAQALLELPAGSTAVVSLNSENIFAILHRLGVPVAPKGEACAVGEMCVPCLSNDCFPPVYDRLWYVALTPAKADPAVFLELRYGAGWSTPE